MQRIDGSKLGKLLVLCLAAGLAAPALSQEQQRGLQNEPMAGPVPVRVRHFEGVVTVQRASAGGTSEAIPNLPLDAGDRIWTEHDGRAELTLSDGTTVWLDERTTLDIVTLAGERGGSTILRLWGGSLLVWRPALPVLPELRLDNGENVVRLHHPGLSRVDIDDEHRLWLSVYDGQASLEAGGLVETLTAGEQSYTEPGSAPATAGVFRTAEVDDFGRWQQQRWSAYAETTQHVAARDYVPAEVRPYAGELEAAGSWFYHDDFGSHAWRPTVALDWSPYQRGRWVWAYGGWTWASSAPWGWATAHYGRWHHLPSYGWVWFPGGGYRSAWVSWYVGYGYVGWSPIGYWGRPFISIGLWFGGGHGYGHGYHGGYNYTYPSHYGNGRAVAGHGYARGGTVVPSGWTLTDVASFGSGESVRRAVSRTAVPAGAAQNVVTLSGALRQRNLSAMGSGRQAIARSAVNLQRGGLSGGATISRGGLSSGAAPRATLSSSGTVRGGAVTGRRALRSGQAFLGAGSDRGRSVSSSARPRLGTSIAGRPAGVSTVRPRPGGLSGGLYPTGGAIRRPSATTRPGAVVRGLRSGAGRQTLSGSPAATRSGGTGRPSISRRSTSLRSGAGSRPGLSARPQIVPRSAPGRSSIGRGASGARVSAPRGAAPRGGGGGKAAPRGGSRGSARRSGSRR